MIGDGRRSGVTVGVAVRPRIARDPIPGFGAPIGADDAVDTDERQQGHQRDPGNPFQHARSISYGVPSQQDRPAGLADGTGPRPIRSRHPAFWSSRLKIYRRMGRRFEGKAHGQIR